MKGTLYLVPTPINDESLLTPDAFELLMNASENEESNSIFVVEDHRPGRRRWLRFGLPRECIENFVLYNEQNFQESCDQLIQELAQGKNVYLMSDAGMPAFCDPGRLLVERCHEKKIKVTSTSFANSVILALALSGFKHDSFTFHGFIPRKQPQRREFLLRVLRAGQTGILMDTAYRLHKLMQEIVEIESAESVNREYFLALDLCKSTEMLIRGNIKHLMAKLPKDGKPEFVLCCAAGWFVTG